MGTFKGNWAALAKDHSGSTTIIFAFALLMLLTLIGIVFDYERAVKIRGQLQQAADQAALAAASDPLMTDAQVAAVVRAWMNGDHGNAMAALSPSVLVRHINGATPSVALDLSVRSPTTLLNLVGITEIPIAITSKAAKSLGFSEIYAAIDMSDSLGLAADAQARIDLEALTAPFTAGLGNSPNGCMFACHQRDGFEPPGKTLNQMAHEAGIPLREDVLNSAFAQFVDTFLSASDPAVAENHKRMGVIGFSDDAQLLQSATNIANDVKAAPATFPEAMRSNTKFANALPQIKSIVGAQGNGASDNPHKAVLLITDGMGWERMGSNPIYQGAMDSSLCDDLKAVGLTVAVLEVHYQDATGEYYFDQLVAPRYGALSPALRACASPGMYFQASDSDAQTLGHAFSRVADAMTSKLALTQ